MIPKEIDIIHHAKCYLRQQEELYGDVLYLSRPDVLTASQVDSSENLETYRLSVLDCRKCNLARTRRHIVFGIGNPHANLMLIGEAPGRDEDLQGEPFVGKAGQLLDKILAAIGFRREDVYIGNILKCRPPDNRDPLPEETALCMPILRRQIEIIQPKIILALGRIAAQVLLGTAESLGRLRQEKHAYQGIPVCVTYHPAALLRNPQWKRATWEDVQNLRHMYDDTVGDKPKWQPPKK